MEPQITRRQLLKSGGAVVVASFALPKSLRVLLESAPTSPADLRARAGSPSNIEHVVVLMMENRSFDHYFGTMPGVRGFGDTSVNKQIFYQPDPDNPDGYLLPFHIDSFDTSAQALPSNSHSWGAQHGSWANGAMNGFVTTHLDYDGVAGQYTMAYFERQDLPFHWALADAFTLCDGYHCSMLGPTWPNRLFLMTGEVDPNGVAGGPVYSNYVPTGGFSWTTYPEYLTQAGVSWKLYQEEDNYGMNVLEYFDQYQNASPTSPLFQNGMRIYEAGQFEYDAMHDQLPTVSWIVPTSFQSEHPAFLPAAGADYIASKVEAIASNPSVWEKTVFVLIYDENDGLFDHVVPPTAPAGTPDEYITVDGTADPIGLGFRVPCTVVSPWTVGGYVNHGTYDHTSVIQLLETVTGVMCPNISAWRRSTVGDLASVLGPMSWWSHPRLPNTQAELVAAEQQVREFQLPPIPAADQTFPVQPWGHRRERRPAQVAGSKVGR
jgi:phospholipase C